MDSTITQGKVQDLFTTLKTQFEDATAAVVENARKNIENTVSTQLATLPAFSQEQVQVQSDIAALNNQVSALVALIEEQQKTIQALSGSFHEVRRDWHMTVTEIRAFTQESPAIQAPAHAPMLTSGVTVEEDKEAQIKKYVLTGILDGHVPSIRDIAKRFHVGTSKAKEYKDSVLRERGIVQ
jgi:chromosome segregation ATPase